MCCRDEYKLLGDHKNGVIDFTIERGQPLAEAVARGVDSDQFFRTLEADRVSMEELDRLSCFCSCQLRTQRRQSERALLLSTVLGLQPDLSENAEARRRTLLGSLSIFCVRLKVANFPSRRRTTFL